MVERGNHPLIEALGLVAPGMPLREGLDRILQADRGALVVVGDDPGVLSICTGGFLLDAEFSPQRLSELAKMDGAIILAADASRIARANVHLVPRASIPTSETGTRHRTAERVARSLDVPVITVSESMSTIAVYRNDNKRTLQRTGRVVDRAGQALLTLQRFKERFDLAVATLSSLEVEDTVSLRDVVAVLQPGERVLRIAEEIESYLVELGEDGRLIHLQLVELVTGAAETLRLVVADYVPGPDALARPPLEPTERTRSTTRCRRYGRSPRTICSMRPWSRRRSGSAPRPRVSTSESRRVGSVCCIDFPGFPTRSSIASWTASPPCRGSCKRRWPISRRSTGSARPRPER